MGETTARQRDGDELLAMDVDYDAIKPAVAPTVQMTEELENIIIQRIRDKGQLILKILFLIYLKHTMMSSAKRAKWSNPLKLCESWSQTRSENRYRRCMNRSFCRRFFFEEKIMKNTHLL